MREAIQHWRLRLEKKGKTAETVPLESGSLLVGRDKEADLCLPDRSISRRHAELEPGARGVEVRDLDSHNGIKVNGVPRRQALLQPGDKLQIGKYHFTIEPGRAGSSGPANDLKLTGKPENRQEITLSHRQQLSDDPRLRQLETLYHACFWLTECEQTDTLRRRLLELLREGLGAVEVQLYSAGELVEFVPEKAGAKRPKLKLASFLIEQFSVGDGEPLAFDGTELARHQKRAGQFLYLVCEVGSSGAGAGNELVVVLREAEWQAFGPEEKVLLQAVCRLWHPGQRRLAQVGALKEENRKLKAASGTPGSPLIGGSPAMKSLKTQLDKAAATGVTVLLQGETGSGKEVVASHLHEASPLSGKPFIKVNCAAIPEGLIESELFGHKKGAFTDARSDHKGKFAQADGGTLFLDEIGEVPLSIQAKLLRAIESGEIEPLGGTGIHRVRTRIIAATNCDLTTMVEEKTFRQDLYYRLNVIAIRVPPLREHSEDIRELADVFLTAFCAENGLAEISLDDSAVTSLEAHHWPGNVRELRNVIQRCAVMADGPAIKAPLIQTQLAALHTRKGK